MTTVIQDRDDELNLAGSGPSSRRPAAAEPVLLGDLASIIVLDLAVRLSGDFRLPRLSVSRSLGGGSETD